MVSILEEDGYAVKEGLYHSEAGSLLRFISIKPRNDSCLPAIKALDGLPGKAICGIG